MSNKKTKHTDSRTGLTETLSALLEEHKLQREIIDSGPVHFLLLDRHLLVLDISRPLAVLWSRTRREIIGKDFSLISAGSGSVQQQYDKKLLRFFQNQNDRTMELTGLHLLPGDPEKCRSTLVKTGNTGNPTERILIIIREKQDSPGREGGGSLKHFSSRLFAFLDEPVSEYLPAEDRFLMNRQLFRLLGYPPEQGHRTPHFFYDLVHPDDLKTVREIFANLTKTEKKPEEKAIRLRKRDGSWLWLLMRYRILEKDASHQPRSVAFHFQDISDTRRLSWELEQYREHMETLVRERTWHLETSNKELRSTLEELRETQHKLLISERMAALGNLIPSITHEVSSALGIANLGATHLEYGFRGIRSRFEKNELSREEFVAFLENMEESAGTLSRSIVRAADLVKSLKTVSADRSSRRERQINFREYLDEIILCLQNLLKNRPVELRMDCPRDLIIYTNPGAVSQIFTNLIQNSLLHAFEPQEKGNIFIKVEKCDSNLSIIYRDNGKGMSAEIRDQIYKPFFTTRQDQGGTGLGLNLIHEIITQTLNGRIQCESEPGRGTAFTITIPI